MIPCVLTGNKQWLSLRDAEEFGRPVLLQSSKKLQGSL